MDRTGSLGAKDPASGLPGMCPGDSHRGCHQAQKQRGPDGPFGQDFRPLSSYLQGLRIVSQLSAVFSFMEKWGLTIRKCVVGKYFPAHLRLWRH